MKILDGLKLADEIKVRVTEGVKQLNQYGVDVGLAVLLVGDNAASMPYFNATVLAGKKVGIHVHEYRLPAEAPP